MSNAIFPTLPGLKWGTTRTPQWSTQVQQASSGREMRAAFWSYPRWKYSLSYEVLRAGNGLQELQQLVGFFNARRGSFDSFLYEDPDDCTATAQQFGVVETGRTVYQLARAFGGFVEPVTEPKAAGLVIKAGSTTLTAGTHYTLGTGGRITLLGGATAGQVLTWSGGFYWRCRFLQDSAEFDQFMRQLWAAKKIEFQTVKA